MEHFSLSVAGRSWNEDRAYSCNEFAFVLDGASALVKEKYSNFTSDAEWCSNWWYNYLKSELCDTTKPILQILKEGVVKSVVEFGQLSKGANVIDFPCTTVSIVRRVNGFLEMYALADSPILIRAKSGLTLVFEDTLNTVNEGFNAIRIKQLSLKDNCSVVETRLKYPQILKRNIEVKNKIGGYYVLSNSVDAIDHGVYNKIEENLIDKVMILSDGYSQAYDTVKFTSVEELLNMVSNIQQAKDVLSKLKDYQNQDVGGDKYIRFKLTDDASIAYLKFD